MNYVRSKIKKKLGSGHQKTDRVTWSDAEQMIQMPPELGLT